MRWECSPSQVAFRSPNWLFCLFAQEFAAIELCGSNMTSTAPHLPLLTMQLIRLEREDFNFYCPATGVPVYDEEKGEPKASTVKGIWLNELPDEPRFYCDELRAQWAAHSAIQDAIDEGVDIEVFLRRVEKPEWVAFEISIHGGAICDVSWTVLDLS